MLKKIEKSRKAEAFKMIELAVDNVELLARAFDTISEVCERSSKSKVAIDNRRPETMIN